MRGRALRALDHVERETTAELIKEHADMRAMLSKITQRAQRLPFHEQTLIGVDEITELLGRLK